MALQIGSPSRHATLVGTMYTALWTAVCLLLNMGVVCVITALCTFYIRNAILPVYDTIEIPLNFVFSTCENGLSGVCSFPTANVSLVGVDGLSLFVPESRHAIELHLEIDTDDLTYHLRVGGMTRMFMTVLRVVDEQGSITNSFPHSSLVPRRQEGNRLLNWAHFTFMWPLYLVGYYGEEDTIDVRVLLHKAYIDSVVAPARYLSVQLQSKFMPITNATLRITALFGVLRYIVFYWPLTSTLAIGAVVFSLFAGISLIYWTSRSLTLLGAIAQLIQPTSGVPPPPRKSSTEVRYKREREDDVYEEMRRRKLKNKLKQS